MTLKSLPVVAFAFAALFSTTAFAKKKVEAKKVETDQVCVKKEEVVSEDTCKTFIANKPGLNGFAVSLTGGLLSVDTHVKNDQTTFNIENKTAYKNIGLGIHHYWTMKNNVVWGLGLDVVGNFGEKTSTGTAYKNSIAFPCNYTQKRPFSASINGKLGYAYGNFVPYVIISLQESYVKHKIVPTGFAAGQPSEEIKDLNIALELGAGFMYKIDSFGFGAEAGFHKESTLGLEGYGTGKNKGCYAANFRISYFF
ncbi:MAG: hypothetical protein KBD31_05275 [Proteobacteria bacterium]|nr:hypothetical protein [Pseudomonadota bacterium]